MFPDCKTQAIPLFDVVEQDSGTRVATIFQWNTGEFDVVGHHDRELALLLGTARHHVTPKAPMTSRHSRHSPDASNQTDSGQDATGHTHASLSLP